MPKYRVFLTTTASASIAVDVPEGVTDPEEIAERAWNQGEPSLCAQCSGWGHPFDLELGEWETEIHESGSLKGVAYVTDEDGNIVTGE